MAAGLSISDGGHSRRSLMHRRNAEGGTRCPRRFFEERRDTQTVSRLRDVVEELVYS